MIAGGTSVANRHLSTLLSSTLHPLSTLSKGGSVDTKVDGNFAQFQWVNSLSTLLFLYSSKKEKERKGGHIAPLGESFRVSVDSVPSVDTAS